MKSEQEIIDFMTDEFNMSDDYLNFVDNESLNERIDTLEESQTVLETLIDVFKFMEYNRVLEFLNIWLEKTKKVREQIELEL